MNNIITGKCVDYTFDGQGIVKIRDRVIFVPALLKDEEAEIEILYRKKGFDVGKIKKILKFSDKRITPKCPCATACGGCSFQNLDYQEQLKLKFNYAKETLKRIGGIDKKISDIHRMNEPYYYRNKIQVPFGYDKQNRLVYGFYKFKTHDIIPIKECVIEDKVHVEILKTIKDLMLSMKILAYNEDLNKGIIRHVLIRHGKVSKETMVIIVVTTLRFNSKNNFVKELIKKCPGIKTVVFNENPRKTNVILGNKEQIAYGRGFIFDTLLDTKFKISPKSFYQVNHDQCEVLYSLAFKKAELKKSDTILDAYCGIGTIGLIASKFVKEVDGVEIVNDAIKDARENIKLNNITNGNYICGDAKNYMLKKKYDVIFVDPPRKGLEPEFLNALLKSGCKKIVYISCDVATLARDLKLLKEKYSIDSIDLVDMFPHTFHVETVCSLSLKK